MTCFFVYRWQTTNVDNSADLFKKIKAAFVTDSKISLICKNPRTPMDAVIDSLPNLNFSEKPDLAEILKQWDPSKVSIGEDNRVSYTYKNIASIGDAMGANFLEAGYAQMFIFLAMQKALSIDVDFLFTGKFPSIFLTPRFLGLCEIIISFVLLGNQDTIKRKNVDDESTLSSLLDDRESSWTRFTNIFIYYTCIFIYYTCIF